MFVCLYMCFFFLFFGVSIGYFFDNLKSAESRRFFGGWSGVNCCCDRDFGKSADLVRDGFGVCEIDFIF